MKSSVHQHWSSTGNYSGYVPSDPPEWETLLKSKGLNPLRPVAAVADHDVQACVKKNYTRRYVPTKVLKKLGLDSAFLFSAY